MAFKTKHQVELDTEGDEQDVAQELSSKTTAVISGNDWTTETIVGQVAKGNILLTPRFQRRDAWTIDRKSRFIESLIVGLPIPQIVLAEAKKERGKFLVLDGKQRLLSLIQFWGEAEGKNNAFRLSGLLIRDDLEGLTFEELSEKAKLSEELNALSNQPIRTVVIKNWTDTAFLHTVFLRLNTGSVNLSPQELRQALLPGPFSDYVDDASGNSDGLRTLLGTEDADPRMRDIEILARFLAFRFFAGTYPGRMKRFLDDSFKAFNIDWPKYKQKVELAKTEFEKGVADLHLIFGEELARKPTSPQFNRAIFDALIYFQSNADVRRAVSKKHALVKKRYEKLFDDESEFAKAIESDTAGAPNTSARMRIWAETLSEITGEDFEPPDIPLASKKKSKSGKSSD